MEINLTGKLGDYDRNKMYDEALTTYSEPIYYSEADEIISRYESEHASEAEDYMGEETYAPSDWLQAKFAWACALDYVGESAQLEEDLDSIEENIELFRTEVELLGGDPDEATFDSGCAYGWEAHNYETYEGVMVWGARNPHGDFNYNPTLLEGELYAVSFKVADGTYLNLAWRPDTEDEKQ